MITCLACAEMIEEEDFLDHLRLFHPDDQPEVAPGGALLIIDETEE